MRKKLEDIAAKAVAAAVEEDMAQKALDSFKQDFFANPDNEEVPPDTDVEVHSLLGALQGVVPPELLGRTSSLLDTLRGKSSLTSVRARSPSVPPGHAAVEIAATALDGSQATTVPAQDIPAKGEAQVPENYAPAKARSARRRQPYNDESADAQQRG